MDPISAISLAGSLVGIGDVIANCVHRLMGLQSKYKDASLIVSLLVSQLTTVKAALNQITDWANSSLVNIPRHEQLVADLDISLDGCKLLISVLEDRISQFERDDGGNLKVKGKVTFPWEESGLNEFTTHLNNQVNALNLLITALYCRTTFERNELLQHSESRQIFKRVQDNRCSLLSLVDSDSYRTKRSGTTENSNLLDAGFDFDNEAVTTGVYRAVFKSHVRKASSKDRIPLLKNASDASKLNRKIHQQSSGAIAEKDPTPPELPDNIIPPGQSSQEYSALKRWFNFNGPITQTTEVDRFSSRLSRASSILRRNDNASIFSQESQSVVKHNFFFLRPKVG